MGNSTAHLDNSLEFFTEAEFQHELQILPLFKYPNKGTQKATTAKMPAPHETVMCHSHRTEYVLDKPGTKNSATRTTHAG